MLLFSEGIEDTGRKKGGQVTRLSSIARAGHRHSGKHCGGADGASQSIIWLIRAQGGRLDRHEETRMRRHGVNPNMHR